jgi:hypothetical protein
VSRRVPEPSARRTSTWKTTTAILMALVVSACAPTSPSGLVSVTSRTANPVQLTASFGYGAYTVDPAKVSIVLSTIPLEMLASGDFEEAQIVHVQMLWKPRAGRTPVSTESTNLSIRYVVLVDGEVGLYGGGGFGWPRGTPGKTGFGLNISGSNLALLDSTDGFRDLLTPARLSGSIGAPLDEAVAIRMRDTVSQIVTNRLGRPQWVNAGLDDGRILSSAAMGH